MRCWMTNACIAMLMVLCMAGCTSRQPCSLSVLDSPDHHVMNGAKLLQKGRIEAARREFRSALRLDPRCAAAFRGTSLIHGMRQEFDSAFKAIHEAIRHTTPEDLRDPVHGAFNDCCRSPEVSPGPHRSDTVEMPVPAMCFVVRFLNIYYRLGVSYTNESEYREQCASLLASLTTTRAFSEMAGVRLARARTLTHFFPGTDFARSLAFAVGITRAEGAGLLVRELAVEALPGVKEVESENKAALPQDLTRHPLKEEIEVVLKLGLDGFPLFEDGIFRPEAPWTRAEYAGAIFDILQRSGRLSPGIVEGPQLSPFEDVPLSASYLKAISACEAAGLLEAEGGKVRPDDPLSGGDALRSIHRLKELLAPAK